MRRRIVCGNLRRPVFKVDMTLLLRFREPLVLVVPAGHPLARGAGTTLDEVGRQAKREREASDFRPHRCGRRQWVGETSGLVG